MTFDAARRRAAAALRGRVDDPAADARHLVAFAAGVPRGRLTMLGPDEVPEGTAARLNAALSARLSGASVAHVTGRATFWGRDFAVTRDTLAPRPETETLIAAALAAPFGTLADLGTGTGCIGLTLLAERPAARGLLTDASEAALAVARRNAAALGVADRAGTRAADWWAGVYGRFDLVVSNPPYVAEEEMAALAPEVRAEPRMALTPGGDGLGAYRAIAAGLAAHLAPGGRILLEIGPTQAAAVRALLRGAGLARTGVHADMDGRDRIVEGRH